MARTKRIGDLEIPEDLSFQFHEWIAERIGWLLLAGVLVCALLGFFGNGHFSNATVSSRDGKLTAQYQRYTRLEAPFDMNLLVAADPGMNTVRVSLSRDYVRDAKFDDIQPTPVLVSSDADWATYTFEVSEKYPAGIRFSLQLDTFGAEELKLRRENSEPVLLKQFVFP